MSPYFIEKEDTMASEVIKNRISRKKQKRRSGFLARMSTKAGRKIIKRRRKKGRKRLTV